MSLYRGMGVGTWNQKFCQWPNQKKGDSEADLGESNSEAERVCVVPSKWNLAGVSN